MSTAQDITKRAGVDIKQMNANILEAFLQKNDVKASVSVIASEEFVAKHGKDVTYKIDMNNPTRSTHVLKAEGITGEKLSRAASALIDVMPERQAADLYVNKAAGLLAVNGRSMQAVKEALGPNAASDLVKANAQANQAGGRTGGR